MNIPVTPDLTGAIGELVEVAIRVGINEGPTIAAMISKAIHGEDPLDVLAKETVDGIIAGGLKLPMAMAAARLARAARA